MNANDRYEIKALAFYKLNGRLAPGKDEAAAAHSNWTLEQRQLAWDEWHAFAGNTINALLDAVYEYYEKDEP